MKEIQKIAKSYDKGIELGKKGIDSYADLPSEIRNHPDYELFVKMRSEDGPSDSGREEIYTFLSPEKGMNFADLGCCLNLMFSGYDRWQSTYYGVDISAKTIQLLRKHVRKNKLTVGGLILGSMHKTPFPNEFFDIGCCIGALEYFERDFVQECCTEFHRVLKPNGKFVLDIPNVGSPECVIAALVEKSLGREDKFDLSVSEFESLIGERFEIEKKESFGAMLQYFLIKR